MINFITFLHEGAKLARVVSQMGTKPFALFSAYRGENSKKKNRALTKRLKSDLRALKYGFTKMEGHWIENQGTPNEKDITEESLFIVGEKDQIDFEETMIALSKSYGQEALIIGDTKHVWLVEANGERFKIGDAGSFKTQELGQAYSKVHGRGFAFSFKDT